MTGLHLPAGAHGVAGVPGAAAEGDAAVVGIIASLLALLLAAKLGEELARRLGQPGVVGELLGGFVVGPFGLGLVMPGETAGVMAELGVVVLLFSVGLEVRVDDLFAVGRPAIATALVAMILPIAAGVAITAAIGEPLTASMFVGLALAATSIGITSRVLGELGVLQRPFSRVILGAAIADDILALILIGLVTGLAAGDLSASTLLVAVSAVGLVVLGLAAARRARGLRREVFTWPMFANTPLVPGFMLMLAVAVLAAQIGLAAIIGAFVAGLVVAETEARDELEHEFRPLASIFTPFFFAVTGAQVDLGALLDPQVALLAIVLAIAGVVTKLVGGMLGARALGRWDAVVVGAGMVPRGEVGIVVANLALASGVVGGPLFAAILAAVVLTTIVAPYLLGWAIRRATRAAPAEAPGDARGSSR